MSKTKKRRKKNNFLDAYQSIRKPMPPPSKTISPKKKYDRRDKSWMKDIQNMEED